MAAIVIFGILMGSVFACWRNIASGIKVGEAAAASAQRARVAVHTVEQALACAQNYSYNSNYYQFVADGRSENRCAVSFTSRLPDTFLGAGYFGNQVVRRVAFYCKPGEDSKYNLVMSQVPLLDILEERDPYEIVLARDVTRFNLEYGPTDDPNIEFSPDWVRSNTLPRMVRVTLGVGQSKSESMRPSTVIIRIVSIPCEGASGSAPF